MSNRIIVAMLMSFMLVLSGCKGKITGDIVKDESIKFANETFPFEVAKLPEIDLDTIETFEDYKSFTDSMNALIEILNRQTEYDIPLFPATQEAWSKVSVTITKYSPLINNYNEVIHSARKYASSKDQENKKEFYTATLRFGFEASLVIWAVFYSAAYASVGIVYRSIGLNKLAFEHPIIVKTILSNWHWTLRSTLVETTSLTATKIFDSTLNWYNQSGKLEAIKNKTSNFINISSKKADAFLSTTS